MLEGFLGAIFGGVCVLLGARWQIRSERKTRDNEDRRRLRNWLQGLKDELTGFYEQILSPLEEQLEDTKDKVPDQIVAWIPGGTEKSLIVFDSQAEMVGALYGEKIRRELVMTYLKAKTLIAAIKAHHLFVINWLNCEPGSPRHDYLELLAKKDSVYLLSLIEELAEGKARILEVLDEEIELVQQEVSTSGEIKEFLDKLSKMAVGFISRTNQ